MNLREMFATMTPEEIRKASFEREIEEWKSVNRFCGKCGTAMRPHENPSERAFVCPACGYLAYPKISPAVIALITRGDEVLLQRNSHYKSANWSLVAGFVDPGESFEEAVMREAREESSIEVGDIRYVMSQTWPFPSNIMVGFRAEWNAQYLNGFVVHSRAFDGLKGDFPIGFLIWKTNNTEGAERTPITAAGS